KRNAIHSLNIRIPCRNSAGDSSFEETSFKFEKSAAPPKPCRLETKKMALREPTARPRAAG
ncbi:MAG: hypothetical protein MJZ35_09515, partial [Bacteroidaceae bacterium]|nr:hypothetical protein [Bacteroidaceae bacterium]